MKETTPETRAREFFESRRTLYLATTNTRGIPTASYAPFISKGSDFYIYISTLSEHTQNLSTVAVASVLLIEDEKGAKNLLARKRITFSCKASIIPRGKSEWRKLMDCFEETFGTGFQIMRPLADFVLFRLEPDSATYIEGFGQAYRMPKDLSNAEHIKGGHATDKV